MPSFLNKYGTLLIFALGMCLYVIHMLHSNIAGFTPLNNEYNWFIDSWGHLEYIRRLANTLHIPAPNACWECHQPPLYYILAAYPYSIAQDFHLMPPVIAVRLFSLVFYMGFLGFGARLLKMEVQSQGIYYIALCLLVFWPLGVTKATMISNDVPLYMAEAAAFYYIMRWRRDEIPTNLAFALLWNAIAIAFKYSGIIITPFICLIFILQCRKERSLSRQLLAKPVLLCFCISLVLVGSTFARTYYHYRLEQQTTKSLLVPTISAFSSARYIPNNLQYFMLMDFEGYVESPFLEADATPPPIEHRYFINMQLKHSLFGHVSWKPLGIAYLLTLLQFSMVAYMGYTFLASIKKEHWHFFSMTPFLLFISIQVSALVTYRLAYPLAFNQDFRFIYPVTIAMAAIYAKMLSWQREHLHIKTFWLGALFAIGFSATSIVFILLNAWG